MTKIGYYSTDPETFETKLHVVNTFIVRDRNGRISVDFDSFHLSKAFDRIMKNKELSDLIDDGALRCIEIPQDEIEKLEKLLSKGKLKQAIKQAIDIYFDVDTYSDYTHEGIDKETDTEEEDGN